MLGEIRKEKPIDEDLRKALSNLKDDGVMVRLEQPTPDNKLIILTKNYKTVIGCNELGCWLISHGLLGECADR